MEGGMAMPTAAQIMNDRARTQNINSQQTHQLRPEMADGGAAGTSPQPQQGTSEHHQGPPTAATQTAGLTNPPNSGLSGLVCNVYRTSGREPRPLVGASTTIIGDKLYVFGGRKLSRTRPQLTSDMYELDLIRRHWSKIETLGDVPPPRYFHSVCALGDTKLVCYGGMSPAVLPNGQPTLPDQPVNPQDPQPEVVVMSDIHIYDIVANKWTKIPTIDSPQGRYAHCASILPSSSLFASADAPKTALQHNVPTPNAPNSGQLGVTVDGTGGAEMIVVGGQDSANHYIEQISVFNLRSLRWSSTTTLGRSCGAYRSVTAPVAASVAAKIGRADEDGADDEGDGAHGGLGSDGSAAMLIYSNYNFLDVKLELQIRTADGNLMEKPMQGGLSPPGLRFPNGGVIDNHFVVSGTFLTTAKQEYALWALDLRTLSWFRIDAGGSTFTQGSWNRGMLWNRRNTFVILGNRKRSLVEDYNHRRINFSNVCMVELEAFGLYDNPKTMQPHSAFQSASSPFRHSSPPVAQNLMGRQLNRAAEDLGSMALNITELCDMDFLAMNGERVPANSRVVARRWGPYFKHLMQESLANADTSADTATLRPGQSNFSSRYSQITITPSVRSGYSAATTLRDGSRPGTTSTISDNASTASTLNSRTNDPNAPSSSSTSTMTPRPRTLYLPHTPLTIQALLHYLYTSTLPPPQSNLCTPQILCSLLQLARPYGVDGLLEAVIQRLHKVLDNRNTAAIFNAAAMAAGGGEGVKFLNAALAAVLDGTGAGGAAVDLPIELPASPVTANSAAAMRMGALGEALAHEPDLGDGDALGRIPLRINTQFGRRPSTSTDRSTDSALSTDSELDSETDGDEASHSHLHSHQRISEDSRRPSTASSSRMGTGQSDTSASHGVSSMSGGRRSGPWNGGLSSVVGLQKRGLRGLMEGRRIREAVRGDVGVGQVGEGFNGGVGGRVGLGIA